MIEPPIDSLDKGIPFGAQAGGRLIVLVGDLHFPLLVLKEEALDHNIKAMSEWCRQEGLLLAPHGKTTMCPQIWKRQLAAGAWGVTVAHASQAMICVQAGVKRILIANQVVDRAAVFSLVAVLRADPSLEIYTLIDSVDGVQRLAGHLRAAGAVRPIPVLLEWGRPHWRTGARSRGQALSVRDEVLRHGELLRFAGVECFEGSAHGGSPDEDAREVSEFITEAIDLLCHLQPGFDYPLLFSAGGSAFLDCVQEGCRSIRGRFPVVLRSGCYVSHDHGYYRRRSEQAFGRGGSGIPRFVPALELWSVVQSIPDPDLAILNFGKRDCSYDIDLPLPLYAWAGGDQGPIPLSASRIAQLNDQHAFLQEPPAGLRVGDLVCCGISHPCTTFDKWRVIPVVDQDYQLVDWYRTYF